MKLGGDGWLVVAAIAAFCLWLFMVCTVVWPL